MEALQLLSGDAQSFIEKVWASHIHVHHTDPRDLVGLLSLDDVDHLLTSTALRAPAVRLAQDGQVLPTSRYTRSGSLSGVPLTGLVDGRKVLDLFEEGATVVLQGLQRYWPALTTLARDLEQALGHPCQANAYLTPPGARGFEVHSDTHDVFVFQTHGTKQWEVHDEAGTREVLLEPGLSMYLPTGTPHAARAQETASLHVTIGINQLTWRDLLRRVTGDLLKSEQYDGRLPAGYLQDPSILVQPIEEHLHSLGAALADQDADLVAEEQSARFLSHRAPSLRGGLRDRLRISAITDETLLLRRPGSACLLIPRGDRLRVLLGDREVDMPGRLAGPMTFLRDRASLTPQDLAEWLDPASRLVLTRRLVREGLLRIAD